MLTDAPLLIYVALFVGVVLIIEGLFRLVGYRRLAAQDRVNRRLAMMAAGDRPDRLLATLRRRSDQDSPLTRGLAAWLPGYAALDRLATHAGVLVPTSRILLIMLAMVGVCVILLRYRFAVDVLVALPLAAAIGIGVPLLWLASKRKRRLWAFAEQLPEAIDIIVRSLRVGHPIATSMNLVAQELADPVGSEFGIACDEMTYGLNLKDAIDNMSGRTGIWELQYLVAAISVQYGTGGNLAEILESLSAMIRARLMMFRKFDALAAQGRLTAIIMTIIPIGLLLFLVAFNPYYLQTIRNDPVFWPGVVIVFTLLILNTLLVRMITKIDV